MGIDISEEPLENRTVLEVGSGRGETTRKLARLLSQYKNTRLIVTDISDMHFGEIQEDIRGQNVQVAFHQTDACFPVAVRKDAERFSELDAARRIFRMG